MSELSLLLVDDELPLLGLLKKYLQREGYYVETAVDGASALAAAQSRNFDLIVLDLNLPDMSGEKVMLDLMEPCPSTRFLICSGIPYGTEQLPKAQAARIGFLLKPFMPRQLAETLKSMSGRHNEASV